MQSLFLAASGGTRTHDTLYSRQSALPTELPRQLSWLGPNLTSHSTPDGSITCTCTVGVKKKFPFPFRFSSSFCCSVPFTSVLTVCRGQTVLALGMNSSAKFTACHWRSIARLFSTTRSRDGFSYHEKGYRPRTIALFIAGVRAGPRGDGSARAYLYFLRFIIECTTSLGSLLVATDSSFLLQAT